MTNYIKRSAVASLVVFSATFASCTSFPSLVDVARSRAQGSSKPDDLSVAYKITDLDVLNFTNEVKKHLDRRSSIHTNVRYGSATTLASLGGLAGASKTLGWSTGTASALGLGATYVFGLGQIFNSKQHAQIYEQSLASVQSAEAAFFYYRLKKDNVGKKDKTASDIPSATQLTSEGEILYYRVTKILNVLYDSLAGKIPDLQDLKEAHGEGGGATGAAGSSGNGAGGSSGGSSDAASSGGETSNTTSDIPEVLKPRNRRLEDAFVKMNEKEVQKKLEGDGIAVPEGSTLKQHVAKLILSEADLPMPAGKDALQSLTFYRQNAKDESSTRKLEEAYRTFHLIAPR